MSKGSGFNNRVKVICQVCGKSCHVTLHCYYRFNITFVRNGCNLGGYRGSNFQSKVEEDEYTIEASFDRTRYFGKTNMLR